MLGARPEIFISLPAPPAPTDGAGARGEAEAEAPPGDVARYFASRGELSAPPPSPPPQPPGPDGKLDYGTPLLGGTGGLDYEAAIALLSAADAGMAVQSVAVADAARSVLESATAE